MPKVKVPRKSTTVDMTAMCDVAFLLLAFFILTTKFKPPEQLTVVTPKSVSTQRVDEKKEVLVIMDKDGKVYFSMSDDAQDEKGDVLDAVSQYKNLGLTEQEKKSFYRSGAYIGVPFSQLKSYLDKSPDEIKNIKQSGIPVDSANNELTVWMRAVTDAFQGKTMNLLIKGDGQAKYPSFKGVIDALKKNEIFKFQMWTDPEAVPPGTALYKENMAQPAKK